VARLQDLDYHSLDSLSCGHGICALAAAVPKYAQIFGVVAAGASALIGIVTVSSIRSRCKRGLSAYKPLKSQRAAPARISTPIRAEAPAATTPKICAYFGTAAANAADTWPQLRESNEW